VVEVAARPGDARDAASETAEPREPRVEVRGELQVDAFTGDGMERGTVRLARSPESAATSTGPSCELQEACRRQAQSQR
jgi:hypothetical protein